MSNTSEDEIEGELSAEAGGDGKVATVAQGILAAYFDKLAGTEGFAEIAPKLRKVVLDDGQFNDAAVRAALFDGGT